MTEEKNEEKSEEKSATQRVFEKSTRRFSSTLSDLREFSVLVESLISKHRLAELEQAVRKYEGLGDALCQIDDRLKKDIDTLLADTSKEKSESQIAITVEVANNERGRKYMRVKGRGREMKEFDRSVKSILKSDSSVRHLHRSSLISLVSTAESFVSTLLHQFYSTHPAALNAKEKQFTFDELSKFDTMDDARSYIVSWKVENLLRGSVEDWFEFFRNNLKLKLSVATHHAHDLTEIFQRRNLFVHNDGVVNNIYLSKVKGAKDKTHLLNKQLGVTKSYLFSAIDKIEASFLDAAYEIWSKCEKSNAERPLLMVQASYDALTQGRWNVAKDVASLVSLDKDSNEISALMAKVNSWIARSRLSDQAVRKEIEEFDVSAKDDLFRLAKHCLLDENDQALVLAKSLHTQKKLEYESLAEWPLFESQRQIEAFQEWLGEIDPTKIAAQGKDDPVAGDSEQA